MYKQKDIKTFKIMVKNLFEKVKTWCVDKYTTTKEKLVKLWNDYKTGENDARSRFNKTVIATIALGFGVFSGNFLVEVIFFLLVFCHMIDNLLK